MDSQDLREYDAACRLRFDIFFQRCFLTLNPGAEWDILVFALVVVIIGGLGSLEGAILGSIIVGLLDAYGRWLLPEFSYFVLFGPMAVLLLFRVTGIFGKEH